MTPEEKFVLPPLETPEQIAGDRLRRAFLEGFRAGATYGQAGGSEGLATALGTAWVNSAAWEHAEETINGTIGDRAPLK